MRRFSMLAVVLWLSAARMAATHTPTVKAILVGGRPAVLYSREDISAALPGIPASTIDGYDTASAFALMRNFTPMACGSSARPLPAIRPVWS